jgi:hypothetical protein
VLANEPQPQPVFAGADVVHQQSRSPRSVAHSTSTSPSLSRRHGAAADLG